MRKLAVITGYLWLALAASAILIGHGYIWYSRGFGAMQDMLSPFNFINYGVMIVTLCPGLFLLSWGKDNKYQKEA